MILSSFRYFSCTGAQCNGVCECPNANGRESCGRIISLNDENDCFLVGPITYECKDAKCPYADGFYQRFSNVCRRESIQNEPFNSSNVDSIELNSIGAESNSICTSIGTQTPSVKDATIQTTHSLESLTDESPSDLNHKFSSFSNRRIRNYINYSKLVNREFTKTSSIDSSCKDESTQFGESWESENKSWTGVKHNYCRKSMCQCHDPFYPKDDIFKGDIDEVGVEEVCCENGNVNPKVHRHSWNNEHFHYPETRNHFTRRIPLGHHTHQNQYLPFSPSYYDKSSSVFCPCYNLLRFNSVIEKCDFKQENEQCTEKFQVNSISNNFNSRIFDSAQRSTWDYKENFIAQAEQQKQQHSKEESTIQVDNELINNRAFVTNADYKVEILDEKIRKNQIKAEFMDNDKDIEKDLDLLEDNEQTKPLLGDKINSVDRKDEKQSLSKENVAVDEEAAKEDAEGATECANGCHCHHHEYAMNSIRVRPSKKKSSRTSPLKVITLLLFASAFLITGSALKDAYYP